MEEIGKPFRSKEGFFCLKIILVFVFIFIYVFVFVFVLAFISIV